MEQFKDFEIIDKKDMVPRKTTSKYDALLSEALTLIEQKDTIHLNIHSLNLSNLYNTIHALIIKRNLPLKIIRRNNDLYLTKI